MKHHRIVIRPGDQLEIELTERLENGYQDALANLYVLWQDRDAPLGEVATRHREVRVDVQIGRSVRGRVGPIVVTHR